MTSSAYRDTSDSDSRGLSDLQVNMFKAQGTLLSFASQDEQNALPDLFGEIGIFFKYSGNKSFWLFCNLQMS